MKKILNTLRKLWRRAPANAAALTLADLNRQEQAILLVGLQHYPLPVSEEQVKLSLPRLIRLSPPEFEAEKQRTRKLAIQRLGLLGLNVLLHQLLIILLLIGCTPLH